MENFAEGRNGFELFMLERMDIQKIQNALCRLSNVFVYAVDSAGAKITEMSGRDDEVERLWDAIGQDAFLGLFHRVMESPLEDQLVEDTEYANIKIAAVAVKSEGRPIMCWLACCVLNDIDVVNVGRMFRGCATSVARQNFYRTLDLLSLISRQLLALTSSLEDAQAESMRNRTTAGELGSLLKRTETMTSVVQLLSSDGSFEEVCASILELTAGYLGVARAQLLRVPKDGQTMDVLSEWVISGRAPFFERARGVERPGLYHSEKPMVISRDTAVSAEIRAYMQKHGIRAFMAMPFPVKGGDVMYLSIMETEQEKIWMLDEVKFVSDVAKILQSILVKHNQNDFLKGFYASQQAILDNVGTCVYVRDVETKEVLFANTLLKRTFEEELARNTLDELLDRAKPLGVKEGYYEVHHTARKRWYDMYYTYITWVDGRKVSLCALYDITDKKLYQKKIEQQAYTDFLTGLYNRMCCERDLAGQIDKARINHSQGGLLYMDLDDFKHINDGLGHRYGDVLLKSISNSLQRIEGITNSCYRMGGDEFVIIVPPESYHSFERIVEEIKEIFSKPWFLKDADYYCTMSMGICIFPEQGEDVQELIKKADIAMYEAKKSGKNRVCSYSKGTKNPSNRRLDMEKNMRDASNGNCQEFEVYFQPIIDIQKKGTPCVGAEALLRWNSTALGFIPPSDFIPLAEYLGLINPIGNHVLREACKACKSWNDNGHPEYKVNVNLSVVQLLQNDIVEIVSGIVKETGINPQNLTLEVTESLAINDMERMKAILGDIRKPGIRIALDDFGTGYSSLNHIRELPLDVIKVDQTFVTDLAEDEYSQSFIKIVSELADAIDVNICVEGIETQAQYKVLEGMKVSMVQGYYFDRPMQRVDFERKYIKR